MNREHDVTAAFLTGLLSGCVCLIVSLDIMGWYDDRHLALSIIKPCVDEGYKKSHCKSVVRDAIDEVYGEGYNGSN